MRVYVLLPAPRGDWSVAQVLPVANRADAKSAARLARRRYERPLVVVLDDRERDLGSFFGRAGVALNGELL